MTDTEIKYLLNDIALNSSRASFKRLYQFYYSQLFWFAKSIVKTEEAAEEIVDDVFLNLWMQRARLTDISNFGSYCYVSVKNKSLTLVSKNKLNQVNIDDIQVEIADPSATGEDKLICADTTRVINNTLNMLSGQCKVVFKLVKEDGLKYREVAELLDLSVKTVEYHMGNALKQVANGIAASQKNKIAEAEKIFK
jgi:RNA polymerase sigma-70 factor (ECF subfamily)